MLAGQNTEISKSEIYICFPTPTMPGIFLCPHSALFSLLLLLHREDKHPGSLLRAHPAWEWGIVQQGPRAAEPAPPQRACSGPFGETMCIAPGFT